MTYFTPCSSVSIVNFEQVNAGWDCAKCPGKTALVTRYCYEYLRDNLFNIQATPASKPHFGMLVNFDKDGSSNSLLDIENSIYSYNQSFDIFTSNCGNKTHDIYEKEEGIYLWLKQYYVYENILSITFLGISVILELLLLMVYLTFRKTTVAGKNLMSFCVTLLTCDIIGLILPLMKNRLDGWSCKAVAFILHIFSLALCTWPCIMTCELWSILRFKNKQINDVVLAIVYKCMGLTACSNSNMPDR